MPNGNSFEPVTLFITLSWIDNGDVKNSSLTMDNESLCREILADGDFKLKNADPQGALDCFLRALSYDIEESTSSLLQPLYRSIGDACFALHNYGNAAEYYKKEIALCRSSNDSQGEMMASGQIALAMKSLGKWDEGLEYAQRQLEISREIGDDTKGLLQASYNVASLYYAKAKAQIIPNPEKNGLAIVSDVAREHLFLAITYYKEYYETVRTIGDLEAQGRVCGNLGNIYYLLKQFPVSIMYHQERLILARECGDLLAERRGYINLGNCHILLGQFSVAEQFFLKALELGHEDPEIENQLLYCLANTKSLMKTSELSERHLTESKTTKDRLFKSHFSNIPLTSAPSGSQGSEEDLEYKTVTFTKYSAQSPIISTGTPLSPLAFQSKDSNYLVKDDVAYESTAARIRRISMEHMDGLRLVQNEQVQKLHDNCHLSLTPNLRRFPRLQPRSRSPSVPAVATDHFRINLLATDIQNGLHRNAEDDDIFDLLNRVQSNRINDQRCSFYRRCKNDKRHHDHFSRSDYHDINNAFDSSIENQERFLDFIAGIQSKRLNDQRAELPNSPVLRIPRITSSTRSLSLPGDEQVVYNKRAPLPDISLFLNNKLSGQPTSAHRINSKQSDLSVEAMSAHNQAARTGNGAPRNEDAEPKVTLPDSFFDMLMKVQSARMEDQRASINLTSLSTPRNLNVPNPSPNVPARRDDHRDLCGSHSPPK